MAIQLVNVGTLPNDGEGDPLRTAFQKINNNFIYLQTASTLTTSAVTLNNTANQVVFEFPADEFTMGKFQIKSYKQGTNDSQMALLAAQIYNDETDVKYTIYSINNVGDWLTQYDMDVFGGNVRLLVSPIQNTLINHFIAYEVTFDDIGGVGAIMTTESGESLTTETGVLLTTEG
jgi:hypothetical protein